MAASSDPEALAADKLSKIYQTLGVQQISFTVQLAGLHTDDRSIITCYDVTNSPELVRPVSRVRFDRVGDGFFTSNSR